MSDPLAEIIAMLNLRAVLTKTIEGAGEWRVIRSDQACRSMAWCWKEAVGWK